MDFGECNNRAVCGGVAINKSLESSRKNRGEETLFHCAAVGDKAEIAKLMVTQLRTGAAATPSQPRGLRLL